ncbi:hypothetical protein GUJ93_ZPchr0003g18390 [Zizania palustris]|uniref:Protein kinase domain-containing protein n=1 Tax=Zizania palustris TaxID=103762 RepID=A0A8J5SXE2_ZIZPA|nr:hypothetical protein GUJ93_ZPchr0003g18390 [Zizania palustris]
MERPPPPSPRILLVFLVAVSWPLCSAGTGGFGAGAEELSSNGASSGPGNFRRFLQIGGVNQGAPSSLPHEKAPPGNGKSHGRHTASGPVSAPSPSPFASPPGSSPSPSPSSKTSPSRHDPSTSPPHLVRPRPATPRAEHDRPVETPDQSGSKRSWTAYGLVAAGIAAFAAISAAGVFYCRAKKMGTVRPWVTGLSGQLQKAFVTGVPALKRSELETACEDFSNIIGSTSSCVLYKGTLSSGVEIAVASSLVTSPNDWSKGCESQYRKKITCLSKVSHKNFMNLLGYCEDEQPFTRVMVFEYAPNGTLFEYLHVREVEKLDWMTRLRISMGVAYCLEHMHQLKPPVVPRNFDSTTIYLTEDFAAKVSDLEFWDGAKEPQPTNSDSSSSSDLENTVRKYGIVLLEILTGRVPSYEEDGPLPLEQWASRYFNGEMRLVELIDPSIGSFSEEAAHALCKVVRSCIDPDPKRRPHMAEVAARMREITTLGPDRATPKVSPLWWAELEIMSSES